MNNVFMRFPGGKAKAVTFSYDDGVPQDKRLVKIFDRYNMKATFNLNCENNERPHFTKEEIHEYYLSRGHEVAIHGANHRPNGNLRSIEGIREVLDCRLELEVKCERIIRGMAYPDSGITFMGNFGSYEQIKNYLIELDIAYARTLCGDNDHFMLPDDFHAWMPSAHHGNPKIMEYIDTFLNIDTSMQARHELRAPRLFYIWGHSFEFDRNNNWDRIEEICNRLANKPDVWYATNIEIYDYVQAYKSLIYSADGHMVYNPSALSVWIDVDGAIYLIESGKTLIIKE